MKLEFIASNFSLNALERLPVALLGPQEVGDTWRWLLKRQVRQTFFESATSGNFHLAGLTVMLEEVSSGHGCAAKKDAFPGN